MTEESPNLGSPRGKSWLDKLTQAFAGEPRDREALMRIMRDAQRRGLLDAEMQTMMEGMLQIAEMQVRDIMIPRAQMVMVSRDASIEQILPVVLESGFSRFPVMGESRDEIVGILLAKDLLRFHKSVRSYFNLQEVLRHPVFVPESKRLNILLKEFRTNRNHMAIVVDEYGGVGGLVTIEDVLEQIVGEIDDEHDIEDDEYNILKYSDTRFLVKALTDIEDFNEYFQADFSDEEFDTVGGLLMHTFGHLPRRGEVVRLGRFEFRILRADSRRLHLVQVNLLPEEKPREKHS